MSEVTPINKAQELWMQHKNIKERLGELSMRMWTISELLYNEYWPGNGNVINDEMDAIVFLDVIEEACKEMKVLIEKKEGIREEIDKVEEKSLWSRTEGDKGS